MRKKLQYLVAGVLSIFLLVSCGEKKESELVVKDTIIVSDGAEPKSLDPHSSNDAPSSKVNVQIYDRLVEQDENMSVVPGLAESWEQPDSKTTIFHLRKGVKFHNGEELKASDVKFSLERMIKSPQTSHIVNSISNIEVLDDYTVKVETKEPFGGLLSHLAHSTAVILNEKAVKEAGDNYGQNPIGTGPYKFVSWQSGDRITLEANPDYYLGETPIKNLVFKPIVEVANRTIAVETKEVDIAYDIEGMDREKLKNDKNINFIEEPSLSMAYLGFNLQKAPFNDIRVRQAIAMAIDTDSIIATAYNGAAKKANSIIGPKVFGYNKDAKMWKQDIEKAKELLAEAGYPNGFKTKIWLNDNPVRRDIAIILQDQLKQVGIDATIETLEWGAYLDGTSRGDHEMFLLGWVSVTGDADYGMYALLSSSCFGGAGNRCFYSNPKVDELLEKARTSTDVEERKALYGEIQEIVQEELPLYTIAYTEQNAALQKNIENFKLKAAGHHRIYGVKFKETK